MTENDNKDNINNSLNEEQKVNQENLNSENPQLDFVHKSLNDEPVSEASSMEENKPADNFNNTGDVNENVNSDESSDVQEKEITPAVTTKKTINTAKESNYQISLIDENILQIKISTGKSVSVDCAVRDKSSSNKTSEKQTNKIFIHPKDTLGKQEIEIFVRIGSEGEIEIVNNPDTTLEQEKKKPSEETSTSGKKLTPNPIVADILSRFTSKSKDEPDNTTDEPKTPDEILEERLYKKNPWRIYKQLLFRNLQRGFISAVIITFVSVILFYAAFSKEKKDGEIIEQPRLIVMQDLPENLNKLNENVEDPNKPPEPPKDESSTTGSDVITPVTPKKIKPPRIITPKINTPPVSDTNISKTNQELDSLRKKNNLATNDGTSNQTGSDTGQVNTSLLPDSLLKNLAGNEVGLIGKFPPNWKQIDSREINQKDVFQGVLLIDTTAKKKEESLNMSILLDDKGEYFRQYSFTNVFTQDSLRTIYSIDPKIEGKLSYYRFYIASRIQNVFINAFVAPAFMDKYKAEIEQVVKTIRIEKP